jgi:hypothetical protein
MAPPIPNADAIARLTAAADTIAALRGRIEAGEPWPVKLVEGEGPESDWGPPEILAHVSEMLPFWLGEIERVLAGSPEPVPFGRTSTDRLRVMTIERDRSVPIRELIGRIQSDVRRYAGRVPELSEHEWGRRGLHPRLGEMTVAEMLPRFVVTHVEEHAVQLKATLEGPSPKR